VGCDDGRDDASVQLSHIVAASHNLSEEESGVMHLGWMAAIGALILLEKLAPSRKWIPHAIGTVFMIVGAVVMLFANVLSRLSSYVLQ
jgi:hypothetical protein